MRCLLSPLTSIPIGTWSPLCTPHYLLPQAATRHLNPKPILDSTPITKKMHPAIIKPPLMT